MTYYEILNLELPSFIFSEGRWWELLGRHTDHYRYSLISEGAD